MDYKGVDRIRHAELMDTCQEIRQRSAEIIARSQELLRKRALKEAQKQKKELNEPYLSLEPSS